jgi:endo-1,4-beta-D-glucanase Y
MLLAVVLGSRDQFDALWAFSRAHPSEVDSRLMDWKVPESRLGDSSAFDGDADMAYALVLAHRRWGGSYLDEARTVIAALRESAIGPRSRLPLLGDWVMRSQSGYTQWQFRSSDCMPANFSAFGDVDRRDFWRSVTRACVKALRTQSRKTGTGLVSDFLITRPRVHAVKPGFLEAATDGQYNYNAGRVPWRLAQGGPQARAVARRISAWARTATDGDPLLLRAGYTLHGEPAVNSDYFTSFFAAPLAAAASTSPKQRSWERSLLRAVRERRENYYEDSVTLLSLLTVRGAL